jgi:hypothetical protein
MDPVSSDPSGVEVTSASIKTHQYSRSPLCTAAPHNLQASDAVDLSYHSHPVPLPAYKCCNTILLHNDCGDIIFVWFSVWSVQGDYIFFTRRDSSFSAYWPWVGCQELIRGSLRDISPYCHVHTGSRPHFISYPIGTAGSFSRRKWRECETSF